MAGALNLQQKIFRPDRSTTRVKAIRAKCIDCIYDEANGGTLLQQITLCSCPDCPLWEFRPVVMDRDIGEGVLKQYGITEQPYGGYLKGFRERPDADDE